MISLITPRESIEAALISGKILKRGQVAVGRSVGFFFFFFAGLFSWHSIARADSNAISDRDRITFARPSYDKRSVYRLLTETIISRRDRRETIDLRGRRSQNARVHVLCARRWRKKGVERMENHAF